MKALSFASIAPLLVLLAACSSGSSTGSDAQTSTNTVPAATNINANEQPSSADDPTGTPADNLSGETNTTSEGTTSEDGVGNGTNGEIATNNGVDGTNGEGQTTENNTQPDTIPAINPESSLGQLVSSIQFLVGKSLLPLNQALNQGEMLSTQQEACLGAFDPALGEPLLAIDCERALSIANAPIYANLASLKNTPECNASLQNNSVEGCFVEQAALTVNTLWFIPPSSPGQPDRPQPKAGAFIKYAIEEDNLIVENLPNALAGVFKCEYNLTTGNIAAGSLSANCDTQLARIKNLIDEHLANAN